MTICVTTGLPCHYAVCKVWPCEIRYPELKRPPTKPAPDTEPAPIDDTGFPLDDE